VSVPLLEQPDSAGAATPPAALPEPPADAAAAILGPPAARFYLSPARPAVELLGAAPARAEKRASRSAVRRHAARHVVRKVRNRKPVARIARVAHHAGRRARSLEHRVARRAWRPAGRGLAAVAAYARAHLGARYVSGAAGEWSTDCSGFTKRAYAAAGITLPHSSGAQRSRSVAISRSAARPGDLVTGPGHVGIYMGHGMMIDAGNPRVDVSYRPMYAGLTVRRVRS